MPSRKAFFAFLFVIAIANISHTSFAALNSKAEFLPQEQVSLAGSWNGLIESGTVKLRLVLKLTKSRDGGYAAVVNSPDQSGDLDLAVDTVVFKDSVFRFEMKDLSAVYEGTVNSDGTEIVGRWTQGGAVVLIFRREDAAAKPVKPFKRGSVKLEPCNLPKLTKDARCGKYEVFEDRAGTRGRKIALNILILPASGDKPKPDPVFFLAGGPGQSAVNVVKEAGNFLVDIRRERDLVFVDQRGTGASNPLDCNFFGDRDDMTGYFGNPMTIDKLRACRADLEKVANLALYTTPLSMDDIDEVRAALGYEHINILGGSYGTNAALVYLRQHPNRVRALVLKGVAPTDFKMPLTFAKGVQHAVDRLLDDCSADATCQKTFPNLKAEFVEVLARLDKAPVKVDVLNLVMHQPQQVSMDRATFMDHLRLMLYVPEMTALLPLIIHTANENDFAPFAAYGFILARQLDPQIARGMQLSVVCSEHVPFINQADILRETSGTYYGDGRTRNFQKACEEWPSVKAPASFIDPVKSDVPVLMVSGEVDPVTPPWIGAAAAKHLPNSRQIVIHNGTHLTESPCIQRLISEFLSKGSAEGLDGSCVDDIKRPPFIYRLPATFKPPQK